jgi:cysteine desulfurase / selenocysteine lyase
MPATTATQDQALEAYRELFPVTRQRAYLNHAALGSLSTRTVQVLGEHLAQHSASGSEASPGWNTQRERTRAKMARWVGADPGEIAMVKNTPEAMSLVANGLRFQPGDRVIICDLEFPANASPWLGLARQGVETLVIPSEGGRVPEERIIDAIDDRTRLVALSWVQFSTGYRSDLRTIARACHARGALLAVDVMQGLGALAFDVRDLDVDFFGAASHKWLLGPAAIGWFFCRRELLERVEVTVLGQGNYQRGPDTSWLDYELPLWPDARRFEPGIANSLCVAGLEATLDLLAEVGIERIQGQVQYLSDRAAAGVVEKGYILAAPRDGDHWSGVVSFRSDRTPSAELFRRLEQHHVVVSLREGMIRVSPHFYNNEADIDRLLAALP